MLGRYWSLEFSLSSISLIPDVQPCEVWKPSWTRDSISIIQVNCWALLAFLLSTPQPQNCLIRKLGHYKDHFICFPISETIVLHWLIFDVLKTVVSHTLSIYLVVSRRSINSVPVIIFWLVVEVLTSNFILMLNLTSLVLFSGFFSS